MTTAPADTVPSHQGFILQATYRVVRGVPVVWLAGRLESGESFLIRERRERPRFWIPASGAATAAALGAPVAASPRRSLQGEALAEIELVRPADVPALRERLERAGVRCLEADVPFATRFLLSRGIRGAVAIRGEGKPAQGFDRVFDDPELAPGSWTPTLRVLSLDIETDPRGDRLLSIALSGCGAEEVWAVAPPGAELGARPITLNGPATLQLVASAKALLTTLGKRVAALDPDVLTGWNVVGFDLVQLDRFARREGVLLGLGRGGSALRLKAERGFRGSTTAEVAGRVVLDGVDLLRGASVRMESYSLDAVSKVVLGEGKTFHEHDQAAAILAAWTSDLKRFAAYNLRDAQLVLEVLERLGVVDLAVARSRLTGMTVDRVAASIASFDFLYLEELGRRGLVAESVGRADLDGEASESFGGHVLEPRPGLYDNVLVVDFRSLYPSLIRTFEIDPLGYVPHPAPGADLILAPNGAAFRRVPRGILPELLDQLMPERAAAIARGDRVASQAIKILMNSFYGVLGTSACRFYQPAIAGAITAFGRELLLFCKGTVEEWGLEVLYGDTDSLFIASGHREPAVARELAESLPPRLDAALADYLASRWRVQSRLHVERDRLFRRLHLPPAREGGGARKRYAGLVEKRDGTTETVLVGLEAVRRDWTGIARDTQRELYRRLFADEPLEQWLAATVETLRRGDVPQDQLLYRKRLTKGLDDYTSAAPPHVVAARLAGTLDGWTVTYAITVDGPQPLGHITAPLDLEHYVQRQIRPIAEPILAELGLVFDRVVGDDRQLALF